MLWIELRKDRQKRNKNKFGGKRDLKINWKKVKMKFLKSMESRVWCEPPKIKQKN